MTLKPSDLNSVKSRGVDRPGEMAIPPLDAKPVVSTGGEGVSMAAQADLLRDPSNPLSPRYDPTARRAQMDMRPGAAGQRKAVPTEDIVKGFEALAEFNAKVEDTAEKGRKELVDRKLKADSVVGIGDEVEEFLEQVRKEMNKTDEENTELRKAIEARCSPLSIEQLLDDGEVRQEVPIVRDSWVVTFRTYSGEEDLGIKRLMYGVSGSEVYVQTLMGLYQVTLGIYAINGNVLPSHLDKDGKFDRELFLLKFDRIQRYPLTALASIGVNFRWFDDRARRLFIDVDELKNG